MKLLEEIISTKHAFITQTGEFSSDLVLTLEEVRECMKEYAKVCLAKAAREAEVCTYYVDDEGEEIKLVGQRIYGDDYKYKVNFDCLPTFQVDKQSITNIELP